MKDEIIAEVWRNRDRLAAKYGHDLDAIVAAMQERERFDADSGKDIAAEVREYFIPDFSHWKDHDAFEAGFARLLSDLKADSAPALGGK